VNKRETSGKPGHAAEAVRDGLCGVACLSFEVQTVPVLEDTPFCSRSATHLRIKTSVEQAICELHPKLSIGGSGEQAGDKQAIREGNRNGARLE
jgi:hypothetical protein